MAGEDNRFVFQGVHMLFDVAKIVLGSQMNLAKMSWFYRSQPGGNEFGRPLSSLFGGQVIAILEGLRSPFPERVAHRSLSESLTVP